MTRIPAAARRTTRIVAALAAMTLLVASCTDDGGSASDGASDEAVTDETASDAASDAGDDAADKATTSSSAAPSTTTTTLPAPTLYTEPGPYEVGVTTLTLEDGRLVEVFYPASDDAPDVAEPASYRTDDALSEDLRALVPPDVDLTVPIDGWREPPPSDDGPFPLLMFSHGFGAFRNIQSALTAGIASHGIVVASVDHLERGLLAVATNTADPDRDRDIAVLLAARDAVATEYPDLVDLERQAAAGHSAGGGTVLGLTADDGFDTVVGWAAAGDPTDSGLSTLLVVADNDIGVGPEVVRPAYEALAPPKAFANILRAGHNSFTDACANLQRGQDLIALAVEAGFPIEERLLELGRNGCEPGDLPVADAYATIQHLTVGWILQQTGTTDTDPLAPEAIAALPATVEVDQE